MHVWSVHLQTERGLDALLSRLSCVLKCVAACCLIKLRQITNGMEEVTCLDRDYPFINSILCCVD